MEIFSLRSNSSSATRRTLYILRKGGVFIFPTDTVYGIGGDALRPSVVRRIRRIKGRARKKPFPWLVSDFSMAKRYGKFSKKEKRFADNVWPGATTLVVSRRKGEGTVALRIPNHVWLRKIIRLFGRPIVGTSANQSGRSPARTVRVAKNMFPHVELVIDGGTLKKRPSRIVDCTKNEPRVIRK